MPDQVERVDEESPQATPLDEYVTRTVKKLGHLTKEDRDKLRVWLTDPRPAKAR